MNEVTLFFDNLPIRKKKVGDDWWVSATDTAKAIGYKNPSRDVKNIIKRNKRRFEGYTKIIEMTQYEGVVQKTRKVICLNLKGIIALCSMSSSSGLIDMQRFIDMIITDNNSYDAMKEFFEIVKKSKTVDHNEKEYIYIIKKKNSNEYKIGKSQKPKQRIKSMETHFNIEIEILEIFETFKKDDIEKKIHDFFKDKRLRGEWFNLDNKDIAIILTQFKPYE